MCGDIYPSLTAVIIRASQGNHANSSSRCLILHTPPCVSDSWAVCVVLSILTLSHPSLSLSLSRLVLSRLPPPIALLSLRSNNSMSCVVWSSSTWWLTSLRSNSSHHVPYQRLPSDLTSLRSSCIHLLPSSFLRRNSHVLLHICGEFIRTWWCTTMYPHACMTVERSEESENDCLTLDR